MHFFEKLLATSFFTAILVLETKCLPVPQNVLILKKISFASQMEPHTRQQIFKRSNAALPKTNTDKAYFNGPDGKPDQTTNSEMETKFHRILVQIPNELFSKSINKNDIALETELDKNNKIPVPSDKIDDLALEKSSVLINQNEDFQSKSEVKINPDDNSNNEIMEPASARYYYRPLFRIRHLTRSHRRFYDNDWKNAGYLRPGKDVGYMNSYDDFPTVA